MRIEIDLGDLGRRDAEVEYDYQPFERMTQWEPGCEESVTITKVTLIDFPARGIDLDVSDLIEKGAITEYEYEVLDRIREDAAETEYAAREDRRAFRVDTFGFMGDAC